MKFFKTDQELIGQEKHDDVYIRKVNSSRILNKIANDSLLSNFEIKQLQFSSMKEPMVNSNVEEQNQWMLSRSASSIQSPQNEIHQDSHDIANYRDPNIKPIKIFNKGFSNSVWQKGSLRILYFVSKFIIQLMINSEKFKFSFINKRVFQTINDKGSDFDYYLQNGFIRQKVKTTLYSKLSSQFQKSRIKILIMNSVELICYKYIKVLLPDSLLKIIWDLVVMATLIINIVGIPLKVAFKLSVNSNIVATILLDHLPIYIFVLEMMINFNTAFYSHGVIITNKTAIAKNYVKGDFMVDIIVAIVFSISKFSIQWLDFVLMFKITRVVNIFENLEEILNLRERFAAVLDVYKLISSFIFVCHLIACAWFFIGQIEPDIGYEYTWIYQAKIQDKQWYSQYITSLYWSIITTLTIGYGDIVGQTDLEKVFIIFVGLTSSIMFGYIITDIGQIFQRIGENKKKHRDKMSLITNYINSRGIDKELQTRVKKFFEYYFKVDQEKEKECENLMNMMGDSLKQEVKIDLYKTFLINSLTLKTGFSDGFINQLCQIVQEKLLLPEEIIFQTEQQVSKIYFIINGEVELYINMCQNEMLSKFQNHYNNGNPKNLNIIGKGAVFGERSFLTDQGSLFSAKSKYFTRIGFITNEDFLKLLDSNMKEKQKYFQMRHQIMLNECLQFKGCELCYRSHDFTKCLFTFYRPNPRKIQRVDANLTQNRSRCNRPLGGKYNTLQFLSKTQGSLVNHWLKQNIIQENHITTQFFDKYGINCKQFAQEDSRLSQSFDVPLRKIDRPRSQNTNGSKQVVVQNQPHQSIQKSRQQIMIPFESKGFLTVQDQFQPKTESMIKLVFQNDPSGVEMDFTTPKNILRKSQQTISVQNFNQSMLEQIKLEYMSFYFEDKCPNFDRYKDHQDYFQNSNVSQVLESISQYQNKLQHINPKFKRYFAGSKGSQFGFTIKQVDSIRRSVKKKTQPRIPSIDLKSVSSISK